jgi:tetratricopeptide (TPR) repeat protein
LQADPIIPEFAMYRSGLESFELSDLTNRMSSELRANKDRFMAFTDVLVEGVATGEWANRTPSFMAMCAKASFLRGMYGYNQILAKGTSNLACKAYAAAAYCRQSLDPRWLNNLSNYASQAWQSKDYVVFSEISGELASILIDLGYTDRANRVATDGIEKATAATTKDASVRSVVQSALLRCRIVMAYIMALTISREEGLIRLESAEEAGNRFDDQLALTDIRYYRAKVYELYKEYDTALGLLDFALRKYERIGHLQGVANARNLRGAILIDRGQLQDARDQFEELLIIQQQLNNQIGLVNTLINVGEIDRSLDQFDQMETYNKRALEISQEAEYVKGIATATVNLGDVALRKGDTDGAVDSYLESIRVAEGAGMRDLQRLVLFHLGDAYFIKTHYEEAIDWYRKARKLCQETNNPVMVFNAIASEIVTKWAASEKPSRDLLDRVKSVLVSEGLWLDSFSAAPMRNVRQMILEDPLMQSEVCIFFDAEKNFECRVERLSLKKECFGNLFWMRSLCPYFRDFIARVYK